MRKASVLIWLIGAFVLAGTVQADDPLAAARTAYADGRFLEAADLAQAVGTSAGYALAADCVAKHGFHLAADDEKDALYERAMRLAEEAVRLDPNNPEAHLQVAHAVGRYSEGFGPMKALREGYPRQVREAMETALALDPDMVGAEVSLGGWHAAVVGRAGGLMARMLGATRKKAIAHFDRGLELAPDLKEAYFEYANGLLAINPKRYRERARELLTQGIELPPQNAFEQILHDKAVERLATLD
ncbi:MAG: hypothetical protein OXH37_03080 [Gammaproteobacteria bacterium]|nr:hypothetical protein [Gammaproteobacteria bacterium]